MDMRNGGGGQQGSPRFVLPGIPLSAGDNELALGFLVRLGGLFASITAAIAVLEAVPSETVIVVSTHPKGAATLHDLN